MKRVPLLDRTPEGNTVVKPRPRKLSLVPTCTLACHNGVTRRAFEAQETSPGPDHGAVVPEVRISSTVAAASGVSTAITRQKRNLLVVTSAIRPLRPTIDAVGKCHGDKLRDWRDGIHGKRIGVCQHWQEALVRLYRMP
ncbi:MAG: hypothetical protein IPL58_10855 [Betaproteobacteria bacterium]|uniref:Uncharacterized protein n=1 Tax=Candidatus Proximibacter danicus TaxID=2954365 RepID=A0A9D7K555_9PROT|nr:hypothetical protein [Candidatus Proximibacter danicus]